MTAHHQENLFVNTSYELLHVVMQLVSWCRPGMQKGSM